ncbi:hypothetical protein ACFQ22_08070 [Lentilactobacillus raoultii]|uniref:Uncharacterized protein n=1 Tax=Lentilactobacillus raoultii TaxID=1987503 RepID=A0ABW3PT06_9LACO|nr:hypothetical protein [Lentilactobacillus raoultii]
MKKYLLIILGCLLVISWGSMGYYLSHDDSPQKLLSNVASQNGNQRLIPSSVITLNIDKREDQVILGTTTQKVLIVSERTKNTIGYQSSLSNFIKSSDLSPKKIKFIEIPRKGLSNRNFFYGRLKSSQPTPEFKGQKLSTVWVGRIRLWYTLLRDNDYHQITFPK